ncbi:hypothetical protein FRX31_013446, partial [Thalictrum thalictroides]
MSVNDAVDNYPNPISEGLIEWIAPPPGWIKLNCDACFHANKKQGVVAMIARDVDGRYIAAGTKRIQAADAKVVEYLAAEIAVKMALDLNLLDVIIERDNLNVINYLKKHSTPPWNSTKI